MLDNVGLGCTQAGPNSVALRVPYQAAIGSGGFQRSAPTGGVA
jgi:hypothetical protein